MSRFAVACIACIALVLSIPLSTRYVHVDGPLTELHSFNYRHCSQSVVLVRHKAFAGNSEIWGLCIWFSPGDACPYAICFSNGRLWFQARGRR